MLSVVLVNFNTKQMTMEALHSIKNQADEIIVVDNASQDGSVESLREWEKRAATNRLILNQENLGFAKANNQGFELCNGEYVLLLNTDTLVPSEGLTKMVAWMEQHPDYGGCGPKLVYPDGKAQHSPYPDPNLWMFVLRFLGVRHLLPGARVRKFLLRYFGFMLGNMVRTYLDPVAQGGAIESVESLAGAALMVRRCVIEQVGGLDEGYFMYLEDSDWCIRIRKAGWKLGFIPDVEIVHYAGASFSGAGRKSFRADHPESFKSVMRYSSIYLGTRSTILIRLCIIASLFVRSLLAMPKIIIAPLSQVSQYVRGNLKNIGIVLSYHFKG